MADKDKRESAQATAETWQESGWVVIPTSLMHDLSVSSTAKLLYGEISALCNKSGYCYATTEWLATVMRIGERTVRRCIVELETAGAIFRELGPVSGGGRGYERRIFLTALCSARRPGQNWPGDPAKNGQETRPKMAALVDSANIYTSTQENKRETKRARVRAGVSRPKYKPERFEGFWNWYRNNVRGEARGAAVKAWDKLGPDDDLIRTIGRALLVQVASEEWQRGIGKPYASTYLNGRRWEDVDLTSPPRNSGTGGAPEEGWGWSE